MYRFQQFSLHFVKQQRYVSFRIFSDGRRRDGPNAGVLSACGRILIGNSVLPQLHNEVDPVSEVSSTPSALYLALATGFPTAGSVSKLSMLSDGSRLLFHEACLQSWTDNCVTR